MTKIRDSVALGVFAVLCAPTIGVAGDLSDPGVRNGSFCDPTNSDWMRSNPELKEELSDRSFCDEARLISIGRSVVHAPEYISTGNETSLPIPPEVPGDECTFPLDQRTSVLRMRANHPSTGLGSIYDDAAPTVANVYQTDITLVDPGNIETSDPDDLAVVLLRFDCFALHPGGGAALQVRLIAEKTEGCSPIDWGSSELVLPFGNWSSESGCALSHTMNVLGSPRYRYMDCDLQDHEYWLPRQVPRTNSDGDCSGRGGVELVESLVRDIPNDRVDPPSAAWRTVEMRVDVRTLPGWDCGVGLSQIGNYRFTVAFRLPEEWMVLDPSMDPCSIHPDCALATEGQDLIISPRFPSYAELDQIELRLANLNASVASPCDLIKSEGGQCGSSSTSDPCREAPDGQTIFGDSSFKPDSRDSDVSVLVDVEGTVSCGMESSRNNNAIVYDLEEGTDIVALWQTVNACADCLVNGPSGAPIYRPIKEDSFEPATTPCAGDFTDDGVVDGADFGVMLAAWGACAGCPADLNGDGEVTGADVGLLLTMWGVCP